MHHRKQKTHTPKGTTRAPVLHFATAAKGSLAPVVCCNDGTSSIATDEILDSLDIVWQLCALRRNKLAISVAVLGANKFTMIVAWAVKMDRPYCKRVVFAIVLQAKNQKKRLKGLHHRKMGELVSFFLGELGQK